LPKIQTKIKQDIKKNRRKSTKKKKISPVNPNKKSGNSDKIYLCLHFLDFSLHFRDFQKEKIYNLPDFEVGKKGEKK
jgi:hypothetical protein